MARQPTSSLIRASPRPIAAWRIGAAGAARRPIAPKAPRRRATVMAPRRRRWKPGRAGRVDAEPGTGHFSERAVQTEALGGGVGGTAARGLPDRPARSSRCCATTTVRHRGGLRGADRDRQRRDHVPGAGARGHRCRRSPGALLVADDRRLAGRAPFAMDELACRCRGWRVVEGRLECPPVAASSPRSERASPGASEPGRRASTWNWPTAQEATARTASSAARRASAPCAGLEAVLGLPPPRPRCRVPPPCRARASGAGAVDDRREARLAARTRRAGMRPR